MGYFSGFLLEVQLEAELELARVEGGGGAAAVAPVSGALVDEVNVFEARGDARLVEAVEEVEALGDYFEPHLLAERDGARDAEVERLVAARQPCVTAEAASREERAAVGRPRHAERAVGAHVRAVGA